MSVAVIVERLSASGDFSSCRLIAKFETQSSNKLRTSRPFAKFASRVSYILARRCLATGFASFASLNSSSDELCWYPSGHPAF